MKKIAALMIILALSGLSLSAQVAGFGNGEESDNIFGKTVQNRQNALSIMEKDLIPAGNTVDPEYYYTGPGDIIAYQIIPVMPMESYITVTPENTLLIPRFGVIDLKNKTLKDIKKEVEELVHSRNKEHQIVFSLVRSRVCLITIRGNVLYPGNYTMPASYKVSTALLMADQLKMAEMSMQDLEQYQAMRNKSDIKETVFLKAGIPTKQEYSIRNIGIIHNDGTVSKADIIKAKLTGNTRHDPYIREGDIITVPYPNGRISTISISGEVLTPTALSHKKGDMASMLLKAGTSLTENADINQVRLHAPGSAGPVDLEIDERMNLISEDIELRSGSKIVIGTDREIIGVETAAVSVKGEINKPGVYMIEPGKTTIKDIIETAGGFTEQAYLPLAKLYRNEESYEVNLAETQENMLKYFQYSDLRLEDTTRYNLHLRNMQPQVSVNINALYNMGAESQNITLQDGDVLEVPSNPGSVFVFGYVNRPGYVNFKDNKSARWYIERAGGFGIDAEKGRTRIIRGNNNVWVEADDDFAVHAGDKIYIPRPTDEPVGTQLQRYASIGGILGSTAALLNLIIFYFNTN
ncbi:MAG: SLBB domain-containing protein [Candidatus Kapaibacterium sp.]